VGQLMRSKMEVGLGLNEVRETSYHLENMRVDF
jgi:hypothetical protein